jgi:hypothetical protein
MGAEWVLGFAVSYTGLLIALYKINQASINRSIENSIKILNIEKEVKAMKQEHERDTDKLGKFIVSVQKDNTESHDKLMEQLMAISNSVSSLEGYLKAKQESE